jgi:ribonuclease HII
MKFIIGVDEAGRGPLAGPVAVGIVIVPEGFIVEKEFKGVADSKKLSEKKREEIFKILEARAILGDVDFTVEFESAETIDKEGIVPAINKALARGVRALAKECGHLVSTDLQTPSVHILLDGGLHAPKEYSQETIINGDELIPIISLASIAAKVLRDRLMVELSQKYPEYGFEKHKGYGTKLHYEMLKKYGSCAIHRKSFLH